VSTGCERALGEPSPPEGFVALGGCRAIVSVEVRPDRDFDLLAVSLDSEDGRAGRRLTSMRSPTAGVAGMPFGMGR
jgi:hypothetical protein